MSVERVPIATPRLSLEPLGPEHADGLWDAIRVSLDELRPWLTWAAEASPEAERSFCAQAPAGWEDGSQYVFAVTADGVVIGGIGLHRRHPLLRIVEIGYWLRSDRAGRGYTTEAASAAVGFAFDVLGQDRVELRAGVENLASRRVAEKLGFTREGMLRHGGLGARGPYDTDIYGLLRTDPRS